MTGVVIPFKQPDLPAEPTAEQIRLRVQEIAKDTSKVQFDIPHFQHRLRQRDLTMRHVLETMRGGTAVSRPVLDKFGDWRIKLRRLVAGRRVHVVVAVGRGDTVAVITAI